MTQLLRHGHHFSRGGRRRNSEEEGELGVGGCIVHICVSYLHVIKAMDNSAPAGWLVLLPLGALCQFLIIVAIIVIIMMSIVAGGGCQRSP